MRFIVTVRPDIKSAKHVTVCFWVLPMASATSETYLFHGGTSGVGNKFGVRLSPTMQLEVIVPTGDDHDNSRKSQLKHMSRAVLAVNRWTHVSVALNFDKTEKSLNQESKDNNSREIVTLYVNSEFDSRGQLALGAKLKEALSKPWFLGQVDPIYSKKASAFVGKLEDVRLYGRPLPRAEISQIAQQLPLQLESFRAMLSTAKSAIQVIVDHIATSTDYAALVSLLKDSPTNLEEKSSDDMSTEATWSELRQSLQVLQLFAGQDECGLAIIESQLMSKIFDVIDGTRKLVHKPEVTHEASPTTLESDHPYARNTNSWHTLQVEDAAGKGMCVWFDPQSSTEEDDDFVTFYAAKSTSSQVYGASKYRYVQGQSIS